MSTEITPLTLGWTIVYVEDPVAASAFYERTFGLRPEFAAPDGTYAQLDTGQTKLAFAAYSLGEGNFPGGVARPDPRRPCNVELALVSPDVDGATCRAVQAGCTSLADPSDKPHGQRVAYVRDPFGTLIEIASPL
jgi:predicted enzyme related to lactoylglutathione lyase